MAKDGIVNSSRPDGAYLTEAEYDQVFNTTKLGSLGQYIDEKVYGFIATYFNCSNPKECTTAELSNLQWRTGAVTLARPEHLKDSSWIADSEPTTCLTTNW